MIKPSQFEETVNRIGIGNWHGSYSGRYYHKGYAVDFASIAEFGRFCAALAKEPGMKSLAARDPHTDDFGHGMIASWDESLFATEAPGV